DLGGERQILAGPEGELLLKLRRDGKADRHRVRRIADDLRDGQFMEAGCHSRGLYALEIVEGLAAGIAAIERLAGGRTELGNAGGLLRTALRTMDYRLAEKRADRVRRLFGRRDAEGAQLLPPLGGDPVGGPGRRDHTLYARVETGLAQSRLHRKLDREHGRAAG